MITPDLVPPAPALAPASLSPAALARIASRVAGQPDVWQELVRYDPDQRWYHLLEKDPDHEIWLLSWLPGQRTGFHDHGASAGAFAVAAGTLSEHTARAGRADQAVRVLRAGNARSFGRDHVHDVHNESAAPAVSVHAYSPPLTSMRRYELTAGGLEMTGEDREW